MSTEDAISIVRAIPTEERAVTLSTGSGETIALFVSAIPWVVIAFGWSVHFAGADVDDMSSFVRAPIAVIACALVLWFALRARQGVVRVVFDEEGIRELDGDRVRMAIAWRDARAFVLVIKTMVRSVGGGHVAKYRSVDIRFVSPSGELIRVTNHDPSIDRTRQPFRIYVHGDLSRFEEVAATLPHVASSPADPRTERRRGGGLTIAATWFAAVAQLVLCAAFLARIREASYDGVDCVNASTLTFFSIGFAIVSLLRMSRLLGEIARKRKAQRSLASPAGSTDGGAYRAAGSTSEPARAETLRFAPEVIARTAWALLLIASPWIWCAHSTISNNFSNP